MLFFSPLKFLLSEYVGSGRGQGKLCYCFFFIWLNSEVILFLPNIVLLM